MQRYVTKLIPSLDCCPTADWVKDPVMVEVLSAVGAWYRGPQRVWIRLVCTVCTSESTVKHPKCIQKIQQLILDKYTFFQLESCVFQKSALF